MKTLIVGLASGICSLGAFAETYTLLQGDRLGTWSFCSPGRTGIWVGEGGGTLNYPSDLPDDVYVVDATQGTDSNRWNLRTPATQAAVFPGAKLILRAPADNSFGAAEIVGILNIKLSHSSGYVDLTVPDLVLENTAFGPGEGSMSVRFHGKLTIPTGCLGGVSRAVTSAENTTRAVSFEADSTMAGGGTFLTIAMPNRAPITFNGEMADFTGLLAVSNQQTITIGAQARNCHFSGLAYSDPDGRVLPIVANAPVRFTGPVCASFAKSGVATVTFETDTSAMTTPFDIKEGALAWASAGGSSVAVDCRYPSFLDATTLRTTFDLSGDATYDVSVRIKVPETGATADYSIATGLVAGHHEIETPDLTPLATVGQSFIVVTTSAAETIVAGPLPLTKRYRLTSGDAGGTTSFCGNGKSGAWKNVVDASDVINSPATDTTAEYFIDATQTDDSNNWGIRTPTSGGGSVFPGRRLEILGRNNRSTKPYGRLLLKTAPTTVPQLELKNAVIVPGINAGSYHRFEGRVTIPAGYEGGCWNADNENDGRSIRFGSTSRFDGAGTFTAYGFRNKTPLYFLGDNTGFTGKVDFDHAANVTFESETSWFGDPATPTADGFRMRMGGQLKLLTSMDWNTPNRGLAFDAAATLTLAAGTTLRLQTPISAPAGLAVATDTAGQSATMIVATTNALASGSLTLTDIAVEFDGDEVDDAGAFFASTAPVPQLLLFRWTDRMDFSTTIPLLRFPAGTSVAASDYLFEPHYPVGATSVNYTLEVSTRSDGQVVLAAVPAQGTAVSIDAVEAASGTNVLVTANWAQAGGYSATLVATPTSGDPVSQPIELGAATGTDVFSLTGLRAGVTYGVKMVLEKAGESPIESYPRPVTTLSSGSVASVEYAQDDVSDPSYLILTARGVDPGCGGATVVFRFAGVVVGTVAVTNGLFTTADYSCVWTPDETTTVWDRTSKFSAEVVSTCLGDSFTSEAVQTPGSWTVRDTNTYTWIGPDGGEWNDKANWQKNLKHYGIGYPNSCDYEQRWPLAKFTNETIRVNVNGSFRVPAISMQAKTETQTVALIGGGTNVSCLAMAKFFEYYGWSKAPNDRRLVIDNMKVVNAVASGIQNRNDLYVTCWATGFVVRVQNSAAICVTGRTDTAQIIVCAPKAQIQIVSNATVSAAYRVCMGGPESRFVIDDATLVSPMVKIGCDLESFRNGNMPGCGITFRGTHPLLKTPWFGSQNCTNDMDVTFSVPVGGYASAPLDLRGSTHAISDFGAFAHAPIYFAVDPSSPGMKGPSYTTSLVDARDSKAFGDSVGLAPLPRPSQNDFLMDGATLGESTHLMLRHRSPGLSVFVF